MSKVRDDSENLALKLWSGVLDEQSPQRSTAVMLHRLWKGDCADVHSKHVEVGPAEAGPVNVATGHASKGRGSADGCSPRESAPSDLSMLSDRRDRLWSVADEPGRLTASDLECQKMSGTICIFLGSELWSSSLALASILPP